MSCLQRCIFSVCVVWCRDADVLCLYLLCVMSPEPESDKGPSCPTLELTALGGPGLCSEVRPGRLERYIAEQQTLDAPFWVKLIWVKSCFPLSILQRSCFFNKPSPNLSRLEGSSIDRQTVDRGSRYQGYKDKSSSHITIYWRYQDYDKTYVEVQYNKKKLDICYFLKCNRIPAENVVDQRSIKCTITLIE